MDWATSRVQRFRSALKLRPTCTIFCSANCINFRTGVQVALIAVFGLPELSKRRAPLGSRVTQRPTIFGGCGVNVSRPKYR
jgi:hypothetical protein